MFLSKYAVARHIYIPVIKRAVVDFAVGADWTPAGGDVKISIDGGAAANVTNLPSAIAMGNGAIWDFSLTSGEITGKQIVVTVADSATKAVEDQSFIIETYGNPSAQHLFDLGTATQKVDLDTIKTQTVTCGSGVTVLASVGTAATSTAQTGDNFARLGVPAGASVSADIVAINAKTTNLPAAPASTTNITAGTFTTVATLTNAAAVTSNIKKNSASRITFVMTDSTTHAPKTGCTVTAQVSLDGNSLVSCTNSPSEIASGLYTLVLAAADTNANELAYRLTASSADDLVIERVTQP